jgi:hypothetical protein
VKLVSRGKRPPRLENLPLSDRAAWKLIKRCWVKEVVRRSAMEDVAEKMMAWKLNCVFMEIMNDLVHGSYYEPRNWSNRRGSAWNKLYHAVSR